MNNFKLTNPKRVACTKCGYMTRNVVDAQCALCELEAEQQTNDVAIAVHPMAAEPTHQYLDFTTEPGKATLWDEPAPGRYKVPIEEMRKLAIDNDENSLDIMNVDAITNFLFDAITIALETPPDHIEPLLDGNSILQSQDVSSNYYGYDCETKTVVIGKHTYAITINPQPKDA